MSKNVLDVLIKGYTKQFNKYGMGSGISYSELIADLKKAKKKSEKTEYFINGEKAKITKEDIFDTKTIEDTVKEIDEHLKHIDNAKESLEALKRHILKNK